MIDTFEKFENHIFKLPEDYRIILEDTVVSKDELLHYLKGKVNDETKYVNIHIDAGYTIKTPNIPDITIYWTPPPKV